MAFRTVGVRLQAEVSAYVGGITRAATVTKGFAHELDKAAKAGNLDAVADKGMKVGFALAGGFLLAVNAAAKFEKQMSAVKAATHATAGDMEKLRAASLEAGAATKFSATEAAKGVEELAKAGVSARDILGGGLRGALSLAAAGEMEVGEAAETAASALTQFKLSGGQIPHVADLLAAGAGKAQGSVHDMSAALNQSGLVAAQMGLSIEETTGTLAAFASAGLLGSDSGTSFKTMLLRLAAPTDVAQSLMDKLGISAFDAQGKFVGMAKFAGILQKALGGLTDQQRNAALNTIFGTDAIRSAAIVYQQGQPGISGWIDKTNDVGYAAETAADKTDNLMGDVERLTGSLETMAIKSGGGATGGLRFLTQAANALTDQLGGLPPVIGGSLVAIGGLVGVGLLASVALLKMRKATADALAELAKTGPIGEKAAAGLGTAAKWAGRATAAFLALQAISAAARAMRDAVPDVDRLAGSLQDFAKTGESTGAMAQAFGPKLTRLSRDLGWLRKGMDNARSGAAIEDFFGISGFGFSTASSIEEIDQLDKALAQLVSSGHAADAKDAFELIRQKADEQGVSIENLRSAFPGYFDALDQSATAANGQAAAAALAAEKTTLLGGSLHDAAREAGSLKGAFDKLNGVTLSWVEAENGLEASIDDAATAIKKNGKTLDVHSEAGRKNRDVLKEIATKTRDAMQARLDETGSYEDALTVYEHGRQAFIANAMAAGQTRVAAEALANAWMKMPTVAETAVATPGLTEAETNLARFRAALAKIPWMTKANVVVQFAADWSSYRAGERANRWGGLYEKAATGTLRDAATYNAVNPGRYMIAEPQTGGEAFVPKNGDYGRSMSILSKAASWYGASVTSSRARPTWQSGSGGGGTQTIVHEHHHTVTIRGDELMTGFRREVAFTGGSVQNTAGSRR